VDMALFAKVQNSDKEMLKFTKSIANCTTE
jgi:hypothetical protein